MNLSKKTKRKIAVFGSAANPITKAHRALVEMLTHSGDFDLVLFLPSGVRSDKPDLIDSTHRVRMAELAFHDAWIAAQPTEFRLDLREAFRPSIPTVSLLRELQLEYPDTDIIFTAGVDVLTPREEYGGKNDVQHYWKEGEVLMRDHAFAVIPREGYPDPHQLREDGVIPLHFVVLPPLPAHLSSISSTDVRRRAKEGMPISDFVDDVVATYIEKEGLYR